MKPVWPALAFVVATPSMAAMPAPADPAGLVDAFIAAQRAFDQAALARLTAPDYVEISPVGEVDPRAEMLGFYAADRKQAAPPSTVTERSVRRFGDTAVVTLKLAYGPAALRVVYVARRQAGAWRLVSAQYTPIRNPPGS